MRYTKWDFISDAERAELDAFTVSGYVCTGCGIALPTNGAFYRHFVIPDARWLNLGECPTTEKGKAITHTSGLFFQTLIPRISVRKPTHPLLAE